MKKFVISCVFILAIFGFSAAHADEENCMIPPKPLENKMLDSMVGTWKGENDMMGTKVVETVKVSWTLNHQFLVMELNSQAANNPDYRYEGLGFFGLDKAGKVKTWWFDSWGASAAAKGYGNIKGNKMEIRGGNAYYKEVRSFTITANTMTMYAKGTMNMKGKTKSFEQNSVYKKD